MWTIKHKDRRCGDTVTYYDNKQSLNTAINRLSDEGRLGDFEVFELVPMTVQDIPTTVIKKGIF